MKKLHCTSSILLFVILQVVCEGMILPEPEEPKERRLDFYHGQIGDRASGKYCVCSTEKCQCCYKISSYSVCTHTKIIMLANEGNELALEGKLTINNGSIFTSAFKLRDIPTLCYHHGEFDGCVNIKHHLIEEKKVQVCGHIKTSFSSAVLLNVELFCRTFEVKEKKIYFQSKKRLLSRTMVSVHLDLPAITTAPSFVVLLGRSAKWYQSTQIEKEDYRAFKTMRLKATSD